MTRLVLYVRVSTRDQTPDPQLDPLRHYARARGAQIVDEYVDRGVSGAKASRPELDRLMADARRRRFDALAVVKLDRIARSVRHLSALAAELEALGVDLIVLDQSIDTTTPAGRLLFNVLGAIAEFERDLIRERTSAGMAAAKRRGVQIGRKRSLRGPLSLQMERLLERGLSRRAVARELGVSDRTVRREIERLGARSTTANG